MKSLIEKYGFDPVVESEKRKETLKLLERKIDLLGQLRDQLSPRELQDYKESLEKFEQLTRIDRSEEDILFFAYQYFSEDLNPTDPEPLIPAGVKLKDAPKFHIELCEKLNEVSSVKVNKKIAWASPRGSAKSAYLSNIFPIHQTVFRKRKYIMIISETDSVSKRFMDFISNQLKFNELLREDFGELLSPHKQRNEIDNLEQVLTSSKTLIESASTGKQLRGKRNGAFRPDLIVCDDLESQKNTNTADLREKNLHWFNSVILPLGEPEKTALVYMGTAVHKDGLLFDIMKRVDFDSKLFSAVVSPPEREDLWEQYEEILRDSNNPNRLEDSETFYHENKAEMDAGVEVLWEQRWSYKDLILLKSTMTTRSYNSEYLNNPYSLEEQVFDPSSFTYYTADELREIEYRMDFFGSWDMAFGKSNRSDYNAITIVGRDRMTGLLYVVETWQKKCPAHKALEKAIEIIREYRPKVFAVETVQAQVDLFRQLQQRLMKENLYFTKLKAINTNRSMGRKEERIEQLEPLFQNGSIRLKRSQRHLIEELELFPQGQHDDTVDSLQMTINTIGLNGRRRSWSKKPDGL